MAAQPSTLHEAAARGDVRCATAIVDQMLKEYVPIDSIVNATYEDLMARTPLHLAAERGHVDMVAYLVGNAADVNAKDSVSETRPRPTSQQQHLKISPSLYSPLSSPLPLCPRLFFY
jgi:ankyrin repeat protein